MIDTRLAAELKLTSNGDGAKTAKVTVVARSGDAIDHPYWGTFVHDFAGMSVKPKIPLDYNHDPDDSIGYLNKFDTSTGNLICSGVIVLVNGAEDGDEDDDVTALVAKMEAGIPYEASIEFDDEMTLEYVPEGMSVNVNGRDIAGPVTVIRQWTLKAVAICKFGCDDNTSSELQLSKNKSKPEKGFFVHMSKHNKRGKQMSSKNESVVTVEAPAVVEAQPAEVAPVAGAEVETKLSEPSAEAIPAVEADKPAEVLDPATPEPAKADPALALSKTVEAVDPRAEFKLFVATFGDKAADYYAKGMSLSQATEEFVKFLKADNDGLKQRLAAMPRGMDAPVKFSDGESRDNPKKLGLEAVITRQKK